MINVLHVLPRTPIGGVGSFLKNTQTHINKKFGFDYLIIEDVIDSTFIDFAKNAGSKVFLIDEKLKLFNTFKIKRKIENVLKENRYDIVHLHSANVASLVFPICKKYGIKVRILHSHSTQYSDNIFKSIRNYFIELPMFYYTTHNLACSYSAGYFLFKNRPFEVIYNGIDINRFNSKVNRKASNNIIIGHVGNFTEAKNHEYVIEIFEKLHQINKRYKLRLFGDGSLLNKIKKLVKSKNLLDCIVFFGKVENIEDYYNDIDILLLPSLYEGFPVAAMEAQAYGIPVIASNKVTKEIDFYNDSIFLGINKKDLSKWVDSIRFITLSNRNDKANKFRCSEYTIDYTTKKLESFYNNCIEGSV